MKRFVIILCMLCLLPQPSFAQAESWCARFDFTQGQQGWELTYEVNTYHGRYDNLTGFRASLDEGITYEFGRSIRLEKAFSGTITEVTLYNTTPNHDVILLDTNSAITDTNAVNYRVALGNPADTIRLQGAAVSGTLGLEVQLSTPAVHMTTTVRGIELRGLGASPFGASTCDLNIPFGDMLTGLVGANAGIGALPNSLTQSGGLPTLPDSQVTTILSYAKALTGAASSGELFGPFAPVFIALGQGLTLALPLVLVWLAVYVASYAVGWVIWLFNLIMAIIQTIMAIIAAGGNIVFGLIKGAASLIGL